MPGTTPRGYPYPLYSEANDAPAQIQDLAEAIDTDVQTNLVDNVDDGLNQPSVRVVSNTVQAAPTATDVILTYNIETYDNAGWFNAGVSTTDFTVPATGMYLVSTSVVFASNGTGGRMLSVWVNGAFLYGKTIAGVSYDITQMPMTNLVPLTAGDVVTIRARQNSGVSVNITDKRASFNRVTE